jgi:alanine dehydrogenase
MLVGVPKEIKNHEYRVGLLPAGVRELIHHGHQVVVETMAGDAIGFHDDAYRATGAEVVDSADEVFARSEMIVKVKEPQAVERARLRDDQAAGADVSRCRPHVHPGRRFLP